MPPGVGGCVLSTARAEGIRGVNGSTRPLSWPRNCRSSDIVGVFGVKGTTLGRKRRGSATLDDTTGAGAVVSNGRTAGNDSTAGSWSVSAVWGNRGLVHLWPLQDELQELEATAVRAQHHNDGLRAHLRRLRSDRAYLERVIRERLGWVKEGEMLYRLPRSGSRSGQRPPVPQAAKPG